MSKAPKKKGLSMEEKIMRIEEWFVAHPTPYTLKELLIIVPKATGVIPQSIEECLEVLVSEDRICQKKIGINVLFWRFPKTAAQQLAAAFNGQCGGAAEMAKYLNMTVDEMNAEIAAMTKKESQTRIQIEKLRGLVGTPDSIREDVEQIAELQKEERALQSEIDQLAFFDPAMLEKVQEATEIALEAANRWTDNIILLEQNISQRVGLNSRELREQLQLPTDIDYIKLDSRASASVKNHEPVLHLRSAASLLSENDSKTDNDTDAAAVRITPPAAQVKGETHTTPDKCSERKRERNENDCTATDDNNDSSKENVQSNATTTRGRKKKKV